MNCSVRLITCFSKRVNILKKSNVARFSSIFNKYIPNHESTFLKKKRNYSEINIVKSEHQEVIPDSTVTDFFWSKADKWAELTAVVCGASGRELKYKDMKLFSKKLAVWLLNEGFKPGDVIAMILPNMPEFPVIVLGILEARLVVTTLNPLNTAEEIAFQLNNSKAVGIFTVPEKLQTVLEAKNILEETYVNNSSKLKVICTNGVNGKEPDSVPKDVYKYSKLLEGNEDHSKLISLQNLKFSSGDDLAFIPYSSGTTGIPKGVCLTHTNITSLILHMTKVGDVLDASNGKQEVIPCIVPVFHGYGLTAVLLQGLYAGAKIITMPKFEENMFLDVLQNNNCTVLYVAPPLVLYMGSSPKVTKEHLSTLKIILCGAAPIAETDILKCIEKSPKSIQYKQGYGLTEITGGITVTTSGSKNYSSVGKLICNAMCKVIDLETKKALGPNEEGELCFKGPQVMKGYLNNDEATEETIDSDGWLHSGDIGYYDEDLNFYISDRLKELIKVKGFQVAPAELEGILRSHPDIDDACIVGLPDKRNGEKPIGFVKAKKNSDVTQEDLKDFLNEKVAIYKQIDTYIFVDTIPKSAAGKILRRSLKATYLRTRK